MGHRFPAVVLLCDLEDVRIGLKISLCLLAIVTLVGVVGWRSTVANNAVRGEVEQVRRHSIQALVPEGDEPPVDAKVSLSPADKRVLRYRAADGELLERDASLAAADR